MQAQGFYIPHVGVVHRSRRHHEADNDRVKVKFELAVELRICLRAPTKKDFINALYNIQGGKAEDDIDNPIRDEGPSYRWMQMVADQLARVCRHPNCGRNTVGQYQLVQQCYSPVPSVNLAIHKPLSLISSLSKDRYETADCCKIDSAKMLKGDFTEYGYAVARDLLQHEVSQAEQDEFRAPLLQAEEQWRRAFMEEMRLLIGIELMPQERFNYAPFVQTFTDAAEQRHLDRM
jgi:hypothetical protein